MCFFEKSKTLTVRSSGAALLRPSDIWLSQKYQIGTFRVLIKVSSSLCFARLVAVFMKLFHIRQALSLKNIIKNSFLV